LKKFNKMNSMHEYNSHNISITRVNIDIDSSIENDIQAELKNTTMHDICNNNLTMRNKRSKNRRGRREAYRPYYQLSEEERNMREEKEIMRVDKLRKSMQAKGRIIAPYNTTQFLMADHIEETFGPPKNEGRQENLDLYSSKSDEDYMNNEFKKDYETQHIKCLDEMTKDMLLMEVVSKERRNARLESRLTHIKDIEEEREGKHISSYEININVGEDIAKHSMLIQQEMKSLLTENKRLLNENIQMKKKLKSKSDKSSSGESSSSSNSTSDEEERQ